MGKKNISVRFFEGRPMATKFIHPCNEILEEIREQCEAMFDDGWTTIRKAYNELTNEEKSLLSDDDIRIYVNR